MPECLKMTSRICYLKKKQKKITFYVYDAMVKHRSYKNF